MKKRTKRKKAQNPASALAHMRWDATTDEERKAIGRVLTDARLRLMAERKAAQDKGI